MNFFKHVGKLIIIFLLGFFLIVSFHYNFSFKDYQQFAFLTRSFLQGKLYFLESYSTWWHDAVAYQGNYYWPLGPFPSILLLPLAAISRSFFYQGYLQSFLVLLILYLVFLIAKKVGYSAIDSSWLGLAFCFASCFLGVGLWPNSWFFAQVVTTLLVLFTLLEFKTKKRYSLIGILFACILLTRITAFLGIIFFVLEIFFDKGRKNNQKFIDFLCLSVPVGVGVLLWGGYNFARFGNIFEQGYNLQISAGAFEGLKSVGLFSLSHIPTNLFYLLVSMPTPIFNSAHMLISPYLKADPWGMSIFLTSPYLVLLFLKKKLDRESILMILTSVIISVPIITYYGIGWYQFGYRYALDFFPYLFFVVFFSSLSQKTILSIKMKCIILISSIFNLFLFSTIFIL